MNSDARHSYREGISEAVVGNYDAAEYHLLRANEIDPSVPAFASLGWLHSSVFQNHLTAFRYFRKAIRLNPSNGDLYNDCGAVIMKMGRDDASIKWFHRAVKQDVCERRHFALYNLALVYQRMNRPERSRRYLNLALRARPDFPEARRFLSDLSAPMRIKNEPR